MLLACAYSLLRLPLDVADVHLRVPDLEAELLLLRTNYKGCTRLGRETHRDRIRTATRAINRVKGRYSAVLNEYGMAFLNVPIRSVNRKVQGSNPCSGAKFELEIGSRVVTP